MNVGSLTRPDAGARIDELRSTLQSLSRSRPTEGLNFSRELERHRADSPVDSREVAPPSAQLSSDNRVSAAPEEWQKLFEIAGVVHGVDQALLEAVAEVESGFDPGAVSPAGAQGLMQFMPATAAELGVNPLEPASAIDGAARMLSRDWSRFGSVELALAAYNAGAGAVSRHGGIPPYAETQRYVEKVMAAWGRG
ncbi:MAG: soluble lytic murein transglycosylase-like protein [Acidimicrobiales bacterium]|jgi:soluble lytic murein transglycosylase-like protein